MNIRQKLYDSNDSSNVYIKSTNTSVLSKNLNEIINRKPIFTNKSISKKKKVTINLDEYFRIRENIIYNKMITEIRKKKLKPNISAEQNEIIINKMKFRNNYHKINDESIEKENKSFKKRLYNLKPFISAHKLDKEYNERIVIRRFNSNNKKENKSLILPNINSHKKI